jgi:hypothetical protein
MNRAELRNLKQMQTLERYLGAQQETPTPYAVAQMGERDPRRGTTAVHPTTGGTAQVKLISTGGSTPEGAILPSTVLGRGGNYADQRPAI